jgi:hypothetical protein
VSIKSRIIAALVCVITLAGLGICLYEVGRSDGHHQRDLESKAENEAVAVAALATQAKQSEQLIGAINVRTEKTKSNHADFAAAGNAGVRLYDSTKTAIASAEASGPNTQHCAAERELLQTMGEGIEQLGRKGAEIASEADGHAADSLTYQQGWPK